MLFYMIIKIFFFLFKLHEIVEELNKDNNNLRAIADHCEYLTDIIEVNYYIMNIYVF